MALIKLLPAGKDYVWGGDRLLTEFHKRFDKKVMAESWELSCHEDGPSIVASGPFAGKTLKEYMEIKGRGIWGMNCEQYRDFPILIKLIDAKMDLSVQVHPDDAYALKHENEYGKTEVWYVIDCAPEAFIYYGLKEHVTKELFEKAIYEGKIEEVLQKVFVRRGDAFFIAAGTVHAIGAGLLIAEIQQNSNVTYRVYDYNRVDKDNKQRELHIDKVLDVASFGASKKQEHRGSIAYCDYFRVDKVDMEKEKHYHCEEVGGASFKSVLFLSGEGSISCNNEKLEYKKGDSFFLEAGSGVCEIRGDGEFLITAVPSKAV